MDTVDDIEMLVIKALSNKERKNILKIVASHPEGINYTGILSETGLSTGRLNYHLGELSGFLQRDEERLYTITVLGAKTLDVQDYMHQNIDVNTLKRVESKNESRKWKRKSLGSLFEFFGRVHFSLFIIGGLLLGSAIGFYPGLVTNQRLNQINRESQSLIATYVLLLDDNNHTILELKRGISELQDQLLVSEALIETMEKEILLRNNTIQKYDDIISTIENEITRARTKLIYGVNYLSTHWHYESYYLSDKELERDFSLFQSAGLSNISIPIIWNYTEPELGVYNVDALDDIVRVSENASKHDLGVIIDFHTLMNEGSFTVPDWLPNQKFEAVFLNESSRKAWLNFLDFTVSYLTNETSNIQSWQMMNEPYRNEWASNVTIKEFIDLWREMKKIFTTYSDRPVSIRFGTDSISSHFNYAPEIFEICDYISLNWYEDHTSIQSLREMIANISVYDDVIISEFGFDSSEGELAEKIKEYTELFLDLGIDEWYAWLWRADYTGGSPDAPGTGYNLAKNVEGEPRLAFSFLEPRNEISFYIDILDLILNILSRAKNTP